MNTKPWAKRLQRWRGGESIEDDLTSYQSALNEINRNRESLAAESDDRLRAMAASLRERARNGAASDELLVETFALAREVSHRVLGMRPFDVQVMASVALHRGKLVEMQTGEGKTLAAVLPATLNALVGRGAHILTFNDYLARRDAAWMGPVYEFLGLRVAAVQEGMTIDARRAAYGADVTYATAKEAGFDFLRMHLCREPDELVHRPFHFAIVDEADSILIDEARVPLVIAGDLPASDTSPYRIAEVVGELEEAVDWETDENRRNVFFTDRGNERIESALGCDDLHAERNYQLLIEVNRALHARALLRRDVDYIVRDKRIEIVDEFTGRVVDDRRWPDGLQAAIEAKEGLPIQPGGRIFGSITLQHFLAHYPTLSGMTATAEPAAEELDLFYGLRVVPIPPNRPCVRQDLPDAVFTHKAAKVQSLVEEIGRTHAAGRPVLVGTGSVEEPELLAGKLHGAGIECRVLNARNDEAEAEIIAGAGAVGAVTISTNMAGRGTDIRLGGANEEDRARVVGLGGLYVIGTNRNESRRIDDQLRGRAGRQGDPGTSRIFVSLEDDQMVRFGIDHLIPETVRPAPQSAPIDHPAIRGEVERLQRIVEGQNYEIRKTLWSYSSVVEEQRRSLQDWRRHVLLNRTTQHWDTRRYGTGSGSDLVLSEQTSHGAPGRYRSLYRTDAALTACETQAPEQYAALRDRFGANVLQQAERAITLHNIDACWAGHLSFIAELREWIHLVGIGRQDPLLEFRKQVNEAFGKSRQTIEARTVETFAAVEFTERGIDLDAAGLRGPSSTWTYLINDRAMNELQQMLHGNVAFAIGAVLTTWPILIGWKAWRWLAKRRR